MVGDLAVHGIVGELAIVHGIVARPELNGMLGYVASYDSERGRYRIHLVDGSGVAFKPQNLVAWHEHAEEHKEAVSHVTIESISTATGAQLVEFMRDGCILSKSPGLARACLDRVLKLHDGSASMATVVHGMMNAGCIELIVHATDAHLPNRGELFMIFVTLCNTMVHVREHEQRFDRISQMKTRAVACGIYPRLAATLEAHTTSDILCTALATIVSAASGGDYPETEARRSAAVSLLPAIAKAMKLAPHRSAVQHFGTQAVCAIIARNSFGDISAAAARADGAISLGLHEVIIEAMHRHGHIAGEGGACQHTFETVAPDGGSKLVEVALVAPGSVLLSGCQALNIMIHGGPGNDRRIKSLNQAHALQAVAAAVRANPLFADFTDEGVQDLASMEVVQPLVLRLFGDTKMADLVNAQDQATLMGFMAASMMRKMPANA